MTPLIKPTIHLNGTSKEVLVEQLVAVTEAARALLEAMKKAAPNARDYYPQGLDVAEQASVAWRQRMAVVDVLEDEVMRLAMKITLEGVE